MTEDDRRALTGASLSSNSSCDGAGGHVMVASRRWAAFVLLAASFSGGWGCDGCSSQQEIVLGKDVIKVEHTVRDWAGIKWMQYEAKCWDDARATGVQLERGYHDELKPPYSEDPFSVQMGSLASDRDKILAFLQAEGLQETASYDDDGVMVSEYRNGERWVRIRSQRWRSDPASPPTSYVPIFVWDMEKKCANESFPDPILNF